MTVPSNQQYANGQTPVTGDQFNTFLQTVSTVPVLRQFIGKADMQIALLGEATEGDGGSGLFWWNPNSTALDDGINVIVPPAAASGAWNRLSSALTFIVLTIASLQALNTSSFAGSYVYVLGYYAAGDGGEGWFYVGANAVANGGTIINDASNRSWYRETNGLPYSLLWFGAKPDGTTDNTTQVRNWLGSGGEAFYVPPGIYAFTTATIPVNCAMTGAGAGIAVLRGRTASSTMLSYTAMAPSVPNLSFSGLTFDGGAAGITAISAIFATDVSVDQCSFTGIAHPITLDRCVTPNLRNITVRGNASFAGGQIALLDTSGVASGASYGATLDRIVHDCSAAQGMPGSQVTPLILVNESEQVSVTRCDGIDMSAAGANSIVHIHVLGLCQGIIIDNCTSVGSSIGILLESGVTGPDGPSFISLSGNLIDSFGGAGIQILGNATTLINLVTITGGVISAPEGAAVPCIDFHFVGINNTVSGVNMYQWQGFPTASGVGIQFTSSAGISVSTCGFGQLTDAVKFIGSSNAHISVADCNSSGCTNSLTGTLSGGNRFINNYWNTTPAFTPPTIPSSTVPYINDTGFYLNVSVAGGTVTNITLNNGATGLTSGCFFLPPGDSNSITLVYSAPPTWNVSLSL